MKTAIKLFELENSGRGAVGLATYSQNGFGKFTCCNYFKLNFAYLLKIKITEKLRSKVNPPLSKKR